jgi:hypothetical protein
MSSMLMQILPVEFQPASIINIQICYYLKGFMHYGVYKTYLEFYN